MWEPRRGWFPLLVDWLLAAVVIGFFTFVAAAFVGMQGCATVNIAVGDGTKADEGGKGGVVIRPSRE